MDFALASVGGAQGWPRIYLVRGQPLSQRPDRVLPEAEDAGTVAQHYCSILHDSLWKMQATVKGDRGRATLAIQFNARAVDGQHLRLLFPAPLRRFGSVALYAA